MSDFIATNLHKKVDHIMDVFFGAGVASHPTIIEQINYLLFMRALSQSDDDLRKIGITDSNQLVFDGELEKYRWDNLLTLNAEQLFIALEECFRKIPESTTNKTVRLVFRNAHIKLFDKPTLRTVLHEIDAFAKLMDEGEHKGKRDIFGDTYEYLLSKLAQAGTSGQFRTPRHIIEFLVEVVAPKKGETIIDPAVGTAGFLVKAFEYLRREYTSSEQLASGGAFDKLSSKEHTFLYEHTFSGFDSDEDMIKFGMMNLYLHGLQNARMVRQNTLTDTAGSRDKYDVILANPPFSGKIDRDSVAEELQMNTGATEVLFLRYMMRHLTDGGRAGVIVPEGVLFNASGGHVKIREMLLEHGLWCVVSLPSGVFNPYAGVKTSIIFFDKSRTEKAEVLFAKVENDGYSLGSQRKPGKKNDLPEIIEDIKRYQNGDALQLPQAHVVPYSLIRKSKDLNLNGDRYKIIDSIQDSQYGTVALGEVVNIIGGGTPSKKNNSFYEGSIRWATVRDMSNLHISDTEFHVTEDAVKESATNIIPANNVIIATRVGLGKVSWLLNDTAINQDLKALIPKDEKLIDKKYLMRIVMSLAPKIIASGSGATVKGVTLDYIKSLQIPLPPIAVQQKIVEEIENKQSAIDHARAIISTLERERAYFDPSTRAKREGWPIVSFKEIALLEYGKALPVRERRDGAYPVMGSNGVSGTHDEALVKGPGIVVGRKGSAGSVNMIDKDFWPIDTTYYIKPVSDINLHFLYYVLCSQGLDRLRNGAGIPGLNREDVYNLVKIPLPSLAEQKEIVSQFKEEKEIATANQKLIDIYEQKIHHTLSAIWSA